MGWLHFLSSVCIVTRAKAQEPMGAMVNNRPTILMKRLLYVTIGAVALLLSSCGATKPSSFVKAVDGGTWTSILIREDLTYDKAFNEVLDVVAKRFEMDMISKEGGYGRTNWIYTWNSKKYNEAYRTRVTFKFSADRTKVDIKTEAEYYNSSSSTWIRGFDSLLMGTMKQDISGVVGRTVL